MSRKGAPDKPLPASTGLPYPDDEMKAAAGDSVRWRALQIGAYILKNEIACAELAVLAEQCGANQELHQQTLSRRQRQWRRMTLLAAAAVTFVAFFIRKTAPIPDALGYLLAVIGYLGIGVLVLVLQGKRSVDVGSRQLSVRSMFGKRFGRRS